MNGLFFLKEKNVPFLMKQAAAGLWEIQQHMAFTKRRKLGFYVQTLVASRGKPPHKGGDKCGCMRSAFSLCITVKATTAMRKGA